jgi:uncharacterized protein YbjT (DUF2867 family)
VTPVSERILVVGATGHIGHPVLQQLAATGARVRVLNRRPEPPAVPDGAEVVAGDLTQPDTLDAALDGIDAVFLVWTAPPAAVDAALDRIAARGRRVVLLTSPHKTPHPLFQQPNPMRALHARIEDRIDASGAQWTFLRPGMFAINAVSWWGPQIRSGDVVRWPCMDAPTAPIHEGDVARVAVRALTEDGHAGAEYVLTGPQSLTQAEQVRIIGEAIGRPLRPVDMSPDEARRELVPPFPLGAMNMLLDAWGAATGQPAFVTSTVEDLTGVPPRTFREWAEDHAADFRTAPPAP